MGRKGGTDSITGCTKQAGNRGRLDLRDTGGNIPLIKLIQDATGKI
jgi:hypothetical protein